MLYFLHEHDHYSVYGPSYTRFQIWLQQRNGIRKRSPVQPYFDESFYVGFNIAGYELGLQPEAVPVGENVATFWGVEDIDAEYARFLACGASAIEAPMDVGDSIKAATVKDPWGNLIGLISNPHFKLENA